MFCSWQYCFQKIFGRLRRVVSVGFLDRLSRFFSPCSEGAYGISSLPLCLSQIGKVKTVDGFGGALKVAAGAVVVGVVLSSSSSWAQLATAIASPDARSKSVSFFILYLD